MIYVLTLLACLTTQPDRCARYELQVEACNAAGIGQLAIWAMQHPAWRVERWNCSQGGAT
jgi:hypothetical protein